VSLLWGAFRKRRLALAALAVLAGLWAMAILADELASDLPVAARFQGRLWVLPNVFAPPSLRAENIDSLRQRLGPGDWLVPPLVPYGPNHIDTQAALADPGRAHWLGTDELGRDVFARLVHGARSSLAVGFAAVAFCVLIGAALGATAGFHGGAADMLVSRVVEGVIAFPTFFLVLCVLGSLRVRTIWPLVAVLGLTRWTDVARLVRAEVLRLKSEPFVLASRGMGASAIRLLVRHVLPQAAGPVLIAATFGVASAILVETALSFLGFGVPPPAPSWGELLTQAHRYVTHPGAWWLTVFPGLAIFLTVTSLNLVAEGLRDAMDPRLRS
jgi:peptide/nickel transport system permease protein